MQSRVLSRSALEAPVEVSWEGAELWIYSAPSPDREEGDPSQDALAVFQREDGARVLAVADGMGGAPSGAEAAGLALSELEAGLDAAPAGTDLRPVILDALERGNQAILDLGVGAATTLVVAIVADGSVRTIHVGDSEALVVGQRGRIKLETLAHSPVGYGVAAGLIDREGALGHDERHVLSNHLGDRGMRIEVSSELGLAARDTLLLGSDGLFDNLYLDEIVDVIRTGRLAAAATRLVALCRERMAASRAEGPGKPDDLSFLLQRARRGHR